MRREEIIVTITPEGRATVTVEGIGGPRCEELEQALGVVCGNQRTMEYYQAQEKTTTSIRRA